MVQVNQLLGLVSFAFVMFCILVCFISTTASQTKTVKGQVEEETF